MAIADVLENTVSVCHSQSSGDESAGRRRQCQEDTDHPRLNALRVQARRDAEQMHAKKEISKSKSHRNRNKIRSKRCESNIRSAEISREARSQYVRLMEDHIEQEEQHWCNVLSEMLELTRRSVQLHEKVRARREAKKRPRPQSQSQQLSELAPVEIDGLGEGATDGSCFAAWSNEDACTTDVQVGSDELVRFGGCYSWEANAEEMKSTLRPQHENKYQDIEGWESPVSVFRTAEERKTRSTHGRLGKRSKLMTASPRSVRP
ncbi:unnamed protein product [Agarophyton chilense]|eukprot:gb/GEZJ01000320.1/.p1 GENE.gb/GEZJ01000320.1/~~gb/GEZJ01000320.1/.p1  ORF type:complete len:262 (-),score=26.36 gb/GEZJ01000320.1/:2055-2840(-)